MKPLNELHIGEEGYIQDILNSGTIKRRLLDLGIIKGARICPMLDSATHNMRAYLIKGTFIALRTEESKYIIVEVEKRG